jgi:hypothetical protein
VLKVIGVAGDGRPSGAPKCRPDGNLVNWLPEGANIETRGPAITFELKSVSAGERQEALLELNVNIVNVRADGDGKSGKRLPGNDGIEPHIGDSRFCAQSANRNVVGPFQVQAKRLVDAETKSQREILRRIGGNKLR